MKMRKAMTILETALTAVVITVLASAVIPTSLKNTKKTEESAQHVKTLSYDDALNFTQEHVQKH